MAMICDRSLPPSVWRNWALATVILTVGCDPLSQPKSGSSAGSKKPNVVVVNYALAYFAQRIGGDAIGVTFPVPKGIAPAYWEPNSKAIAELQSADLILRNGADYAKWTLHATLPWSRTVSTSREIEDQYIEIPNAIRHTHGPEGERSHEAIASATWLDPQLAIEQARVIKTELQKLVPSSAADFESNFDALTGDLQQLDEEIESVFAPSAVPWLASDMAFSYLGRRYAFDVPIVHWDAEDFPSDKQWGELEELLNGRPASMMLWKSEPVEKTQDRLRKLGVRVIVFRPGEKQPESGDYLDIMRENLQTLQQVLAAKSSPE